MSQIDTARAVGHRAADGAHAKSSAAFRSNARDYFLSYAIHHPRFMQWQVIEGYKRARLPAPHDDRAWGAIVRKAIDDGIVVQCDTQPSPTSRGGLKAVYHSLSYNGGPYTAAGPGSGTGTRHVSREPYHNEATDPRYAMGATD